MGHIKYRKIRRLGTDETDGILNGTVIIQEKIDGANLSIWLEDGELFVGSRTQIVGSPKIGYTGFRGAVEYAKKHDGINRLLKDNPTRRLCGERLVKHTLPYPAQYMKKFWMFDIMIGGTEDEPEFLDPSAINDIAKEYGIDAPYLYGVFESPSIDDIREFMGKPNYGEHMEGLVLKNQAYINMYGKGCYGKIVCDKFSENNSVLFGNVNKHNPSEQQIASTYVTPGRFLKIINKIEQDKDEDFSLKMMSELMGRIQYDIISEEIMSFIKKHHIINFNVLSKEISNKTRVLALSYMEGEMSVIFNPDNMEYIKDT